MCTTILCLQVLLWGADCAAFEHVQLRLECYFVNRPIIMKAQDRPPMDTTPHIRVEPPPTPGSIAAAAAKVRKQ